jgi:hypothetical protein
MLLAAGDQHRIADQVSVLGQEALDRSRAVGLEERVGVDDVRIKIIFEAAFLKGPKRGHPL